MQARHTLTRGLKLFVLLTSFMAASAIGQQRWQVPEFRVFGEPSSQADAKAIDALMQEFKEAWSAQQTERLLNTHARDVEWVNAYARIFRGTEALQVFLDETLFPAFEPDISRGEADSMTPISRRYVGDSAAVLHWYTDGRRGRSRNEGENPRRTHLHFVLGKQDGSWKIVHLAIFDARK